ncbi:hypothetical protein [Pararhodospirillum oryzae]|uniref:Uncharacterized protein n=1 Tax=Pararhodospirillum oryzae TaxID=478448 RepID=A0A512H667_9PROT|nr:hypothetical protein [Pararhodospirillum oryzae]GEO80966.1 hypothetical protein ROR02_10970 [Pararhodospirillum oryzae]
MARARTKAPRSIGPTPERLAKPDGQFVTVPTESAGLYAARSVPTWERLLSRGVIDDRQATAAAFYVQAWERLEGAGHAPSILLKAGAAVDVSWSGGALPEKVIRIAGQFRKCCSLLGADLFLVDAVVRLDLHPAKSWQKNRLRAALGRLADAIGA